MTYELSNVPSPKDVYTHPLGLFTRSVVGCNPVLGNVEQENYRSFIMAIAKEIHSSWATEPKYLKKCEKAAWFLMQIISKQDISLDSTSSILLDVCSKITSSAFPAFNRTYKGFVASCDIQY